MNNFKLIVDGRQRDIKSFTFNGGEEHISINNVYWDPEVAIITCSLTSSTDVIRLLMLKNALDELGVLDCTLVMAYVPYARQDRVCNKGEALSIKVFCNLINEAKFNSVVITDPHSDVTTALLDNVKVYEQHMVWSNKIIPVEDSDILVIPDAGAAKKSLKVAKTLGFNRSISADKVRNILTGEIMSIVVHSAYEILNNSKCWIFDDICDGGGTFVGLASELRKLGVKEINLCVTHGIFSKGYEALLDNGISSIYTTNSLPQQKTENKSVNVINVL